MPAPPYSHSHSQLSPSLVGVTRPSKSSEFAASVSFSQSNATCSPSCPLMGLREQLWVAHIWGKFSKIAGHKAISLWGTARLSYSSSPSKCLHPNLFHKTSIISQA